MARRARSRPYRQWANDGSYRHAYDSYINSPEWAARRRAFLESHDDGACEACGTRAARHVHHLTYDRLGLELDGDLSLLCEECHQNLHASVQMRDLTDGSHRWIAARRIDRELALLHVDVEDAVATEAERLARTFRVLPWGFRTSADAVAQLWKCGAHRLLLGLVSCAITVAAWASSLATREVHPPVGGLALLGLFVFWLSRTARGPAARGLPPAVDFVFAVALGATSVRAGLDGQLALVAVSTLLSILLLALLPSDLAPWSVSATLSAPLIAPTEALPPAVLNAVEKLSRPLYIVTTAQPAFPGQGLKRVVATQHEGLRMPGDDGWPLTRPVATPPVRRARPQRRYR